MNILMLMSGSIACAKATGLISMWVKAGHQVKIICTKSVDHFVGKATLEGLSGNRVISSVFEEGEMMEHIHLSRWADKIILAPATANCINKLSAGIADDMLTTTWIASLGLNIPLYIAPAMNSLMWNYPATKNSIQKLESWGVKILQPQSGELACGEIGTGRMMEVDEIDKIITEASISLNKQILITAGGTREYIDGVRYIGNMSTGKTGAQIADFYTSLGYQVTWLGANHAIQPSLPCTKHYYETFNDLAVTLKNQLNNNHFNTILQAAAISDFNVSSIKINNQDIVANVNTKLPTSDSMDIKLKKNPKLISQLRKWSRNTNIKIIAFKLTNTRDTSLRKTAVQKLLTQESIDFVIHNDLSEIKRKSHSFTLYKSILEFTQCPSTQELCEKLSLLEKVTTQAGVKIL
jgi:phosphopantothenoylcysteine decarboxylase/phosphopantothenate--cysteine ligase